MKEFLIYILKYTAQFVVVCYMLSSFNFTSIQISGLATIIAVIMMYLADIHTELKKINKNK